MACVMPMAGVGSHNRLDVGGLSNCKKVGRGLGCLGQRRGFGGGVHRWNPGRNRRARLWAQTVRKEEEEEVVMDAVEEEKFDWNKAWYPVRLLEDLEPKKPTAVELLGRQFVLWRDKDGEWRCFRNVCPHRLARLSEGRIEGSDGTLVCSYHGWRFDGEGRCKLIPQQETPPPGGLSERSSVMSFPVKVQSEAIWIWPDESDSAYIDSALVEPYELEYDEEKFSQGAPLFTRELPYPVDILVENILDPSHVPYAHHGIQGNRDKVSWMRGESCSSNNKHGVKIVFESLRNADDPVEKQAVLISNVEYVPPHFLHYAVKLKGQTEIAGQLIGYAIPTSSSSSKIFLKFLIKKAALPWYATLLRKFLRPTWVEHLTRNSVFDGDNVFLAEQGNMLRSAEAAGRPWQSLYYTPTTADLGVNLFRRWFHNGAGGGGPKLPDGQPLLQGNYRIPERRDLLDRYESHTKECKVCSNALWWVRFWKVAAQALCCTLGAMGLMSALQAQSGVAQSVGKLLVIFVSSLAAAGVAYGLQRLEKAFIFKDYEQWKT